jgi:hypothetical protein
MIMKLVGCSSESGPNDAGIVIHCQDKRDCPNRYECVNYICLFTDESDGSDTPDDSDESEESNISDGSDGTVESDILDGSEESNISDWSEESEESDFSDVSEESDTGDAEEGTWPTGQFSDVIPLLDISDPTAVDDDPTLTQDMLEIYFNSNRNGGTGGGDIWWSTRASLSDPWTSPVEASELNSLEDESTPEISGDGLTIYFSSKRPGGLGSYDIWMSTRFSRSASWESPQLVLELNSSETDSAAMALDSGLMLIMYSSRGGTGNSDLYLATRTSTAEPWGNITPLAELNGPDQEISPFLADEGRWVYFESDRVGSLDRDIYSAHRATLFESFSQPLAVDELNSPQYDGDPWVSSDGRYIFFISSRSGQLDLYQAHR